jgi:hypothetical protein
LKQAFTKYMTAGELELLQSTKPANLVGLDEDALGELHARVRRAGSKYRKLHRRQASASVRASGTRHKAGAYNKRTAVKAERFELALARVSRALAKAARESARELKAERLSRVRGEAPPPSRAETAAESPVEAPVKSRPRGEGRAASTGTPASVKRRASTKAAGARRQAKRDAR